MAGSTQLCMSADILLILLGHKHCGIAHNFFVEDLIWASIDVFILHIKRFSRHTSPICRLAFPWLPFTRAVNYSWGKIHCSILTMFAEPWILFKLSSKSCHFHSSTATATSRQKEKIIVIIIKGEQILSVIHYRWVWALGMITLIYSSLKAGPESSTSGLKIFQTRLSAKPVSKTWRLLMVRPTMMTAPWP